MFGKTNKKNGKITSSCPGFFGKNSQNQEWNMQFDQSFQRLFMQDIHSLIKGKVILYTKLEKRRKL